MKKRDYIPMKKTSVELTPRAQRVIENEKEVNGHTAAHVISETLETFGEVNLSQEVVDDIIQHCLEKVVEFERTKEAYDDFTRERKRRNAEMYKKISEYYGHTITDIELELYTHKKIRIKGGTLTYFHSCILMNKEEAEQCEHVFAIACANRIVYGIPVFMYFSKYSITELDNDRRKEIYDMIIQLFPKFESILEQQVEPIEFEDDCGSLMNEEEYFSAPNVFISEIDYYDPEEDFGTQYYPWGVKIIWD